MKKTGAAIVRQASESPVRQLATNAGLEGSVIVARLKEEKQNIGYDISKDAYVDMLRSGIIDPAEVTHGLQNAASIAALLLTTESLITDVPEKEGHGHGGMAGAGMPGGMGGMM